MNIDGHTRLLGLIGYPVKHTLSPVIHNSISEVCKLNNVYVPFEVHKGKLYDAIMGAYALNILGLNVTVPYKNDVISCLVDIDEAAKNIGAVNTLVRVEGGYKGYNTDMMGLLRAIKSENISLKDKAVVILGAGGASKAVAYMCMIEKARKVYILNRTFDKAEAICSSLNEKNGHDMFTPMSLSDYKLLPDNKYIVFQTTSIGLAPNVDDVVIDDELFYENIEVGVDLIYNPAVTSFMKHIEKTGGKAINGLKMLLYQGVIAYELWNNIHIDEDICNQIYVNLYRNAHGKSSNIVLIGYMGSGKSTIGKYMSNKYKYDFIDTDMLIEESEGMKISEIFATKGEEYFRQLETDTISKLVDRLHNTIISTGGGLPIRKNNADILKLLGNVIYLDSNADTIYNRVKGGTNRPILNCENPYKKICEMLIKRGPCYEYASDVKVNVDTDNIDKVVDKILDCLR